MARELRSGPRLNNNNTDTNTNMRHINAKAVRELALHLASAHRPAQGFARVSKEFLERIDAKVRNLVLSEVNSHPSVGRTLK